MRHRKLLTVLLFIGLLLAVAELSGLRGHFSLEYVHARLMEHPLGGLVVFIALFSVGNLIQIPGWIFLAAAVLAFGRTWGGIATYAAATISCGVTFLVIRMIGGNALRQLESGLAVRLLARLDSHPVESVTLLRMLFQTAPALNYALAMSGVAFGRYMIGTLLGLPLPIAAYCVFFDHLGKLFHLT